MKEDITYFEVGNFIMILFMLIAYIEQVNLRFKFDKGFMSGASTAVAKATSVNLNLASRDTHVNNYF